MEISLLETPPLIRRIHLLVAPPMMRMRIHPHLRLGGRGGGGRQKGVGGRRGRGRGTGGEQVGVVGAQVG